MEKDLNVDSSEKQTGYSGFTKVDAPVIHTMPRRFINAKVNTGDSHKGMGLLILGIGVITFIAGAVFVYFYVFNPKIFTDTTLSNDSTVVTRLDNRSEDDSGETNTSSEGVQKSVSPIEETNFSEDNQMGEVENKDSNLSVVSNDESFSDEEPSVETDDKTLSDVDFDETATSSQIAKIIIKNKQVEKKQYLPAPDADVDGLSDAEELILGVNKNMVDTDGDGYSDLAELKNFYNPEGDGKLIVNSGINKYSNKEFGYSLYYPKSWTVSDSGSEGSAVFKIDNSQFVQIVITENSEKKSIEDWYKEQFQVESIESEQKVYKTGWESIKNESGLIYYLMKPGKEDIYVINYNVGIDSVLYYKNIFLLMIESLEL